MRLASDGVTVVICDIMFDNAQKVAAEIEAAGKIVLNEVLG